MSDPQVHARLLIEAGRLLLEYNESTAEIHRALAATAKSLSAAGCQIAIAYGSIAITLSGESPVMQTTRALRYNSAVQERVHEILEEVRGSRLDPAAALARLETVEADTPTHPRWLAALFLGAAAASLATLLGADGGAAAVAGVASGLGLLARQEMGRLRISLLAPPLIAAFIGALLGGIAIRLGWTRTPELVLFVPALMLVPGPHIINGLLDLVDNYVPMSLARLGLAGGITLASAAGIALGIEAAQLEPGAAATAVVLQRLNLLTDVVLAGVVTCGFAVFYNTAWRHLWMAALPGMVGHGLRFLAMEAGGRLPPATLLGGLAVGVIAAWVARSQKLPVAVVAFAGAVTMIPGLQLYRALGGAVRLSRLEAGSDPAMVAETLGNAVQASIVASALAVGLILGVRAVMVLFGERDRRAAPAAR